MRPWLSCLLISLFVLGDLQAREDLFEAATSYLSEQETDKAFQFFLAALRFCEKRPTPPLTAEEKVLYDEAHTYYLRQGGADPVKTALCLVETFGPQARGHPEYAHLNLLIATAYANLGNYEEFFTRFYQAFPGLQDTSLAKKTQGILFLRLAKNSSTEQQRRLYLEEAFSYLSLALDANPQDGALYKVLIFLAKEERNDTLVLNYLQKMTEAEAYIPRSDIYLYVREAVALGDCAIAQQIIDKAKALYSYSRALLAAQDYLNQHRGL